MLAAVKKFKYEGRMLAAGDLIEPEPPAELARQLVEHRFARHTDQEPAGVRPPGTGRGRRSPKTKEPSDGT